MAPRANSNLKIDIFDIGCEKHSRGNAFWIQTHERFHVRALAHHSRLPAFSSLFAFQFSKLFFSDNLSCLS
jgi:hypothetical protein